MHIISMNENVHALRDKIHQVFILEDSSVIPTHLQENIFDVLMCSLTEIFSKIFRKLNIIFQILF